MVCMSFIKRIQNELDPIFTSSQPDPTFSCLSFFRGGFRVDGDGLSWFGSIAFLAVASLSALGESRARRRKKGAVGSSEGQNGGQQVGMESGMISEYH